MNDIVYILTRTSNRPVGFNRVYTSVKSKKYNNIKHIVSIDDNETRTYVNTYHDVGKVEVDKEKLLEIDESIDPNIGNQYPMSFKKSPYNLYCNELLNSITEPGWIVFLDDDNYFSDSTAVSKIMSIPNLTPSTCITWRVRFPSGAVIPAKGTLSKGPALCNIDTGCFAFHSSILSVDIRWDSWKCSDYRFISSVHTRCDDHKYIDDTLVIIGQIGDGQQLDIY